MGAARIRRKRTLILTATKALQQQLLTDFPELNLGYIAGRNSYQCLRDKRLACDCGPCTLGLQCQYKDNDCPYSVAIARARDCDIVVANYHYWSQCQASDNSPLGKFEAIYCDEAHQINSIFERMACVEVPVTVLKECDIPVNGGLSRKGAEKLARSLDRRLAVLSRYAKDCYTLDRARTISKLTRLRDSTRVIYRASVFKSFRTNGTVTLYSPSLEKDLVQEALFPKGVVKGLFSANLTPKHLEEAGAEDYIWREFPSLFPPENNEVLYLPTTRLSRYSLFLDANKLTEQIDRIIEARGNEKGIIHTTSYKLQNLIVERSRYRERLFYNRWGSRAQEIVEVFKRAEAPAVLVSPSVSQGHNFPHDQCHYQIIAKLPFPNLGDPLIQYKSRQDKDYIHWITMQNLVQSVGRGVRTETDRCTTYILDDVVEKWFENYSDFAPNWFAKRIKRIGDLPKERRSIMGASLKPSDAVSGAVLERADVEFTEAEFTFCDYQGTLRDGVPALRVGMKVLEGAEEGSEFEQYYTVGKRGDWEPSANGKEIVPVGKGREGRSINKSSNLVFFLSHLVEAGFNEDDITDDCSFLIGLRCHVEQVAAPERPGLPKGDGAQGRTILVPTALLEQEAPKRGRGRPKKVKEAEVEVDVEEVILGILAEQGPLTKVKLMKAVVGALEEAGASKTAISQAQKDVMKSSYLQGLDGVEVDGRDVKLAE